MQAGGRCCKRMDLLSSWRCASSFFGCVRLVQANRARMKLAFCKALETRRFPKFSGSTPRNRQDRTKQTATHSYIVLLRAVTL